MKQRSMAFLRILFQYAFYIFLSVALTGCITYGDTARSQFVKLDEKDCTEKSNQLFLFFPSDSINFNYERLGLVYAEGHEYSSYEEVLNHLKHEAWKNCANGIIDISKTYKTRESGVALAPDTREMYSSIVYQGMSVRIDLNQNFMSKHHEKTADTASFMTQIRKEIKKIEQETKAETDATIVSSLIAVMVAIGYLSAN